MWCLLYDYKQSQFPIIKPFSEFSKLFSILCNPAPKQTPYYWLQFNTYYSCNENVHDTWYFARVLKSKMNRHLCLSSFSVSSDLVNPPIQNIPSKLIKNMQKIMNKSLKTKNHAHVLKHTGIWRPTTHLACSYVP